MKRMVGKILRQYGTEAALLRGETGETVRCFFQPVDSVSWQSIVHAAGPLGESTRGQYIYIGPADTAVEAGDVLQVGSRSYLLRRAEPSYYSGQVVYQWALCVEKGGDDTWGT